MKLLCHIKIIVCCRLKKEMVARVNQVAAEFRKASNREIADTTKRTIRENVAAYAQLSKISDKAVELIANNDSLKERERRQRQEIELLQTSETLLTEKNVANQKVIFQLQIQNDTVVTDTLGHFTFWISLSLSGIATCTHRPQGVLSGVFTRRKYLLFIIIVIQQKGVMQTNRLADI